MLNFSSIADYFLFSWLKASKFERLEHKHKHFLRYIIWIIWEAEGTLVSFHWSYRIQGLNIIEPAKLIHQEPECCAVSFLELHSKNHKSCHTLTDIALQTSKARQVTFMGSSQGNHWASISSAKSLFKLTFFLPSSLPTIFYILPNF